MSTATSPIRSNPLRAALRMVLFTIWVLWMLPVVVLTWVFGLETFRSKLVRRYLSGTIDMLGIRLHIKGELSPARPLMLVSNHTSYLDIFIIGALSRISFTPKREIRSWPVIGFCCVLADCVFVERNRGHLQEAREEMAKRINMGKVLCLFPEGTTSDGKHIKPFKSGFISLAEEHRLPVQPVSLAYTHVNGVKLADHQRDLVAWIGEATLLVHFFRFLGYRHIDVTVTFHEVQQLENYADRKALTRACEEIIRAQLHKELSDAA